MKFATALDQTNDAEVKELDGEVVKDAYERFAAVTGGEPAPREELTQDQLSGLRVLPRAVIPQSIRWKTSLCNGTHSVPPQRGKIISTEPKLTAECSDKGEDQRAWQTKAPSPSALNAHVTRKYCPG